MTMTWTKALALAAAMGVTVFVTPVRADSGYPPPQYDVGGTTEFDVIHNYYAWGTTAMPNISFNPVPFGEALDACDAFNIAFTDKPFPRSEVPDGSTLLGCLIHDSYGSDPVIVYSRDPARPELAHRILRHEIGHYLGWPQDHRRN